MRIAKADLVPTDANLLAGYASFAELEAACEAFCEQVNARPHRVTRRAPAEMLAEERARLHPLPAAPVHGGVRGDPHGRRSNTPMVAFEGGQYSVPHRLAGQTVWVRRHGEQVVIVHVGGGRAGRGRPPPADHARAARGRRRALPAGPGRGRWSAPRRARTGAEARVPGPR